jgi:broad specificity phosphatase PhoE
MKRIFLVRNAEHALAPLDSWPSDDTGLTKDGRYQAIDIGKVLATCHLTALYSSNRERAKQTAAPTVRRVGLDISYLSNFDAVPLGAYAGLTYREIRDKLGEVHDEILTTPDSTKDYLETGITLDIAAQKAWNELENVARAARNNTSVAIFRQCHHIIDTRPGEPAAP